VKCVDVNHTRMIKEPQQRRHGVIYKCIYIRLTSCFFLKIFLLLFIFLRIDYAHVLHFTCTSADVDVNARRSYDLFMYIYVCIRKTYYNQVNYRPKTVLRRVKCYRFRPAASALVLLRFSTSNRTRSNYKRTRTRTSSKVQRI